MRRRGRRTAGFALAEALVALAVAAMTLTLLTGAAWGLRHAAERRAAADQTGAADWLTARRALQAWVSGATSAGQEAADLSFTGTATGARVVVDASADGAPPYLAELRVEPVEGGGFALVAARHPDRPGMGLGSGDGAVQETEILRSTAPLRLLYLLPREGMTGLVWRYETGLGEALPAAVAVEAGTERMLTAAILPTRSAACLSALGPGGLEERRCALR